MELRIIDEFSQLKDVAVCWGDSVPEFKSYSTDDPEELRWGDENWNRDLLLKQQEIFFKRLEKYDVKLHFVKTDPALYWQMFTRDTAFVLGETLFYSPKRTLKVRNGEIEKLLESVEIEKEKIKEMPDKIEGGDVLASETAFVGVSNRTKMSSCDELKKYYPIKPIYLGDNVMHLDCRMTLLPNKHVLVFPEAFGKEDWQYLKTNFTVMTVTKEEMAVLGTNVLVVNPETIFVEEKQKRIQDLLTKAGFKVESVPYSEPIALGGSFRCTTLPLVRAFSK